MVELSWVTYPVKKIFWGGEKYKDFSQSWEMRRFLKLVKNAEIFQSGEKYRDFSKWSCCNGRLAQVENEKIFSKRWKIQRFFRRKEKYRDFSKVKNTEIFQSVFMGKIWRWWETQGFLKNGFIVMGNRPKWKMKSVLKEVWLQWVTYPDEKTKCLKWHDRTRWGTRAEECTRKEVGLEKHAT